MSEYIAEPQKTITGENLEFFLNLTEDDFTKTFVKKYFSRKAKMENGKFTSMPPKYNVYDKITIPVGRFCNNKTIIHTHLGMFLFFKFMFERELSDIIRLENYLDLEAIDNKMVGKFENILANATITGKIKPEQMITFLNKLQFFFTLASFLNSSISKATGKPNENVMKKKEELLKKNKKAIEAGDTIVAATIEKELLKQAEKELDGDYGMDIYKSGANASFSNNYKAMFIMKGPVKDNLTGESYVITSNYSDGMKKEDLHSHYDSLVYGAYSKGVNTQSSGYLTKKFLAAYQGIVLDKKGTNCGTKITFNLKVTPFNKSMLMYQYIVENNKLVLLDENNIDSYVGKYIHVRLPGGCTGDKTCNICAGEYFYMTDDYNIGLTTSVASGSLLNKSMKKFHDTSVKLNKISIDELIL